MSKVPMTKRGHALLQEEVKKLKSVDRPAVIKAIAEARAHGDLKENAEYHSAKERQSLLEGKISELQAIVANSQSLHSIF